MTMLVGWVAVDQRSIASAYIASDSRFSWSDQWRYDCGRKVFACKYSPDIIAYCGDVLFSSVILSRMVDMIDRELMYNNHCLSEERRKAILLHLQKQFATYPKTALAEKIQIYHVSRDLDGKFHLYSYAAGSSDKWKSEEIEIDSSRSNVIFAAGIGKTEFDALYDKYNTEGLSSDTSRNVFQCFCGCLRSMQSSKCGGAPQLVGLYRVAPSAKEEIRNGLDFGIIADGKRYLLGAEVDKEINGDKIRWYNEYFEICDGYTLRRKKDAMPQPNPLLNLATP